MKTPFTASRDFARSMDAQDPLSGFKQAFYFPGHEGRDVVYFCGNSLGLQPKNAQNAIEQELNDWRELGVEGYFRAKNPWLYYHEHFAEPLSKIMGCHPEEVTVMNTLTINLHLMLQSFYRPEGTRNKIIMEAGAFPSDQYALESAVRMHGLDPENCIVELFPEEGEKCLHTENILSTIRLHANETAMVLMGGINYYTGQFYDMAAITKETKAAGAIAGWDLAHVAGNIPLQLHEWKVDFAVWCSYKYLNGGPGAAGGLFVHEQHGNNTALPRPAGWWGNDEKTRFKMEKGFVPKKGAAGWQVSTAQVFNMVALKASLEIFEEAGINRMRAKSLQLTAFLEFLLKESSFPCQIITPANPEARGAQLSLFFPENGKQVHEAMTRNGIVCDYREPGVIRLAPAPLYCSFEDVYDFFEILKKLN